MSNAYRHVFQKRLNADTVQLGEKLQIKGDQERRDQMEYVLELKAQETLRQAEQQSQALMAAARQEAASILKRSQEEAEETARQIVEAARGEEEALRTAAHDAGFQAGYEEGRLQITDETSEAVQEMLIAAQTLLDGAFLAEKKVLKAFQKDAQSLVAHVAKRVLGDAFEQNVSLTLTLLDQASEALYLSGKIKVVVHPELLAMLRNYTAGTAEAVARMQRFEFMTDELLAPRQIFVLSEQGYFQLTPEMQVDNLLAPLAKALPLANPADLVDEAETLPEVEPVVEAPALEMSEPLPELALGDNLLSEAPLPEETHAILYEEVEAEASEPEDAQFVAFEALTFETVDLDSPEENA